MTTQQVETATVIGTVTGTGNATVTVTSRDITGSPLAVSVAVTNGDTASVVGGLVRTALAFNQYVSAQFLISGTGANVVLTSHIARANDTTLNIAIANDTCTGLTAAPNSTNTTAGDGLDHAYCTLAQAKALDILNFGSTTTHDAVLVDTINAVSREIDYLTQRRFWAQVETRYYTPRNSRELKVDYIADTTGFVIKTDASLDGVYEDTWTSTDYSLYPPNAAANNRAYNRIKVHPLSSFYFPVGYNSVEVTANFGYSATTPALVNRACILEMEILFARYKAPLGVAGATAIGTIMNSVPGLDPKVIDLLMEYKKYT